MTQRCQFATKTLLSLALVLTSASAASAQPNTAQRFEQLQVLVATGDTVKVIDRDGYRMAGRIADISNSRLILDVNGAKRTLTESDVREVRRRSGDSLVNGAWWGLGVGGGIGAAAYAAYCVTAPCSASDVWIVPVYAALGTGIAVGFDALIRRERALYRAPGTLAMSVTPIVGRRTGVGVSFAF